MAVFGAPVAHEDDPERAVRAGLAMQETMERLNEKHAPQSEVNFMLRVGINTGEVLAGRMGDGYTVIGDTVNVAARLQAAARPGTRHRRRVDLPRHPRAVRLPRARAADAEGQVRAGRPPGRRRRRSPSGPCTGPRRAPRRR